MHRRDVRLLILIAVVAAVATYLAWPTDPGLAWLGIERPIKIYQGLDLQGGVQVLLEADLPEDQPVRAEDMAAARAVIENRVNGLGVTEPNVQMVGSRRIQVELPGIEDAQRAIETLRETGLLEWVDTGTVAFPPGSVLETDFAVQPSGEPQGEAGEGAEEPGQAPDTAVFHTVLTGRNLRNVGLQFGDTGTPMIAFELDAEGSRIFEEYTRNNVGRHLTILLDKVVISSPVVNEPIPGGRGVIQGSYTVQEAQEMLLQLRYGALPIPLREIDTREIGPTLGQDSVQKSIRAGAIGLGVVLLFMLVYYRLPGALADLALLIYAVITLALYKTIPVTLTLPGIAGFLLSVGMAVDANILIFERMREELRGGRSLGRAIDIGFRRAWTSILDSNISTWLICAILWAFGNSFGASMVKGFALTLALGVLVSMFTAVTVTRTFVRSTFALAGERLHDRKWLLGI